MVTEIARWWANGGRKSWKTRTPVQRQARCEAGGRKQSKDKLYSEIDKLEMQVDRLKKAWGMSRPGGRAGSHEDTICRRRYGTN